MPAAIATALASLIEQIVTEIANGADKQAMLDGIKAAMVAASNAAMDKELGPSP